MFANVGNSSCPRRTEKPRARCWRVLDDAGAIPVLDGAGAIILQRLSGSCVKNRAKCESPLPTPRLFCIPPAAFTVCTACGDRPFWRRSHLARVQEGTSCVISSCPYICIYFTSSHSRSESIKQKHCPQDQARWEMGGYQRCPRILLTMTVGQLFRADCFRGVRASGMRLSRWSTQELPCFRFLCGGGVYSKILLASGQEGALIA